MGPGFKLEIRIAYTNKTNFRTNLLFGFSVHIVIWWRAALFEWCQLRIMEYTQESNRFMMWLWIPRKLCEIKKIRSCRFYFESLILDMTVHFSSLTLQRVEWKSLICLRSVSSNSPQIIMPNTSICIVVIYSIFLSVVYLYMSIYSYNHRPPKRMVINQFLCLCDCFFLS